MATKQNKSDDAAIVIAVCGGGIAGLSFAIAAKKLAGNVRVVVLERGAEGDGERRTQYSHSLSLRTQSGGIQAVQSLGIYDAMSKKATPSMGGYIGTIARKAQAKLALHAGWLGKKRDASFFGMRIYRFDLWFLLRETALSHGVEIRYGSCVVGVADITTTTSSSNRVRVTCSSGSTLDADLVVAADGVRSAVRTALQPEEKLNFLETIICTATHLHLNGLELPPHCHNHHGILAGPEGTSVFVADEGDKRVMFALGFQITEPVTREALATDEVLRARIRRIAGMYAEPYATLILRLLDTDKEKSYSLSCFDKMPNPPALGGRVVFIGDACHPVSPFGGTGANMALTDGVELANALFGGGSVTASALPGLVLHKFYPKRAVQVTKVVKWQRFMIGLATTTRFSRRLLRSVAFTITPFVLNPKKRRLVGLAVLAAVAGVAVRRWWWK